VSEIVRCPYCVQGLEFRPMVAHVDGRYICRNCGHTTSSKRLGLRVSMLKMSAVQGSEDNARRTTKLVAISRQKVVVNPKTLMPGRKKAVARCADCESAICSDC